MNVLLTCAGRRNYLVRFFKEALRGRGQVIACDCRNDAAALVEADRRLLVPSIDSPGYLEVLLAICRSHAVRLVISLNDLELAELAREAPRFHALGTIPVVSFPAVLAACQDKWKTFHWLQKLGIPTPQTYLSMDETCRALADGTIKFPLLLKPRWGNNSEGIERVENARELALAYEWGEVQVQRGILARLRPANASSSLIVQQWHRGKEYGMDVVNDLRGVHITTLGRRKLAMQGGSTERAVTVANRELERLGRILGERLQHIGCLDCDVLATDNGYQVLDLNPRFGGGYPFSHLAGANIPAALIAWACGEEVNPSWLRAKPDVVVSKYEEVTIMDSGTSGPRTMGCPEAASPLLRSPLVGSAADGPSAVSL